MNEESMADDRDAELAKKFDQDWNLVMAGLDRATEWVKRHKRWLRGGFSFRLNPNADTGIEIHLGYICHNRSDSRKVAIQNLFAGKTATVRSSREEESYRLIDDGLTFKWEIWKRSDQNPAPKTTQVKIGEPRTEE